MNTLKRESFSSRAVKESSVFVERERHLQWQQRQKDTFHSSIHTYTKKIAIAVAVMVAMAMVMARAMAMAMAMTMAMTMDMAIFWSTY